MSDNLRLHILHSCPFSWKVRSTLEHLQLPFDEVQVHPLKVKKQLNELTQDTWGKVPVLEDAHGVHVDSTPIMKYLDRTYADSRLSNGTDPERHATWLEWVDEKFKDATIPILYGSLRRGRSDVLEDRTHGTFLMVQFSALCMVRIPHHAPHCGSQDEGRWAEAGAPLA